MGQHSMGDDNHTWVLRDAFVEAVIPGSIVRSFRGLRDNIRSATRTGGGLIWNHGNNNEKGSA
jgi:hypothetical protein